MAVTLVVGLVGGLAVLGLGLYAHEINGAILDAQRNAYEYAAEAALRGESFEDAAPAFERSVGREGLHSFATRREMRFVFGPGRFGVPPVFLPGESVSYVDGEELRTNAPLPGLAVRGFGLAVAAFFGARGTPPQPFMDGFIVFAPDTGVFQNVALLLIAAVIGAGTIAALLAATTGRLITEQAIRPLIEVTEALQRFAARDFRAQPIAVAGRSDFNVLATAYNAAAAQVAAAFAERDAAESQMRQFVADAGHELRTPLTIVLGYIDLLRRRVAPGEERSQFIFSSISAEGRRMRTLIDNLVLLAKMEGDRAQPPEPFDVGALLDEIVAIRRGLDPAVRFETDRAAAASAIGDRDELHHAFANLVDNAIKYAPGSPIRIGLALVAGGMEVSIADEGPGIPPAEREAIFERFHRGDGRGDVEGSGLGLAIAKRAIERAGGTIRLDPTVERGTRFVVALRADRSQPGVPQPVA